MAKTPYEKIRRAAMRGTGTRLTADECEVLYYFDDAIRVRADADACGGEDRDDAGTDEGGEDHGE